MTLITFQDGKVVLRDGKAGTEQACCCEEQDPCLVCTCEIIPCGFDVGGCSEEDAQDNAENKLADVVAAFANSGIVAALEDNGYEGIVVLDKIPVQVTRSTDENGDPLECDPCPPFFGEGCFTHRGIWSYRIEYRCCGEIDLEAEPEVVEVTSPLGQFLACFPNAGATLEISVFPCNPLP
jgi:hypothetical protein